MYSNIQVLLITNVVDWGRTAVLALDHPSDMDALRSTICEAVRQQGLLHSWEMWRSPDASQKLIC